MTHVLSKTPNKRYRQGKFIPTNPQKYIGIKSDIFYRSSWEKRVMMWFDTNPSVLGWNSEGLKVRYFFALDSKDHTYHVDFLVKMKTRSGEVKTYAIEVKPHKETLPPKTRDKKRLLLETETYMKNQAKWEAAKKYCDECGITFLVLTERDLGIK